MPKVKLISHSNQLEAWSTFVLDLEKLEVRFAGNVTVNFIAIVTEVSGSAKPTELSPCRTALRRVYRFVRG